jgi:hypothetical protein
MRARFTGEVINPGALCVVEKPVAPFLALNLYDLGTTGLLHYVAGRSPYHPHDPLTGKPSREWRLKQACIVIESRAGVDTGARERFIASAGGGGAELGANYETCGTKSGAGSPSDEIQRPAEEGRRS